ncbi:MAG TPA: DUF1761 domain-containing protein [Actinomycetota bacterium]
MTFDTLSHVHWVAIVVATIAYFALGGIWYSRQVFGTAWMRAGGNIVPEGQRPGMATIVGPLVTCFIATIATAMLAVGTGTHTVAQGLVLGLVVGVGYAVTLTVLGTVFDQKPNPPVWGAINSGYHVIGLLIVGAILGAWR